MIWLLAACAPSQGPGLATLDPGFGFGFPIADRELIFEVTGMDHDGVAGGDLLARATCVAYDGTPFPSCYGGHKGNDFLLDGGFETMDAGSTDILAAADGEVIAAHDGEYDRCHWDIDLLDVSCDGHPMRANFVSVRHPNGLQSHYWHLAEGSVAVEVGDYVACGDVVGLMGSSGRSSLPHLHFQVEVNEVAVDPYAGSHSQPGSLWIEQDAGDGLPGACP